MLVYLMCTLNNPLEFTPLPNIDVTSQCTSICYILWTKSQAEHSLDLSHLTENAFLWSESIATQGPELDMLHSTADNSVGLKWMELDVKDLEKKNIYTRYSQKYTKASLISICSYLMTLSHNYLILAPAHQQSVLQQTITQT